MQQYKTPQQNAVVVLSTFSLSLACPIALDNALLRASLDASQRRVPSSVACRRRHASCYGEKHRQSAEELVVKTYLY